MNHDAEPIKNEDAEPKPGGSKSGQECEGKRNWGDEKQEERAHHFVSFVNVSEAGNDTEQHRHRVARSWFGCFRGAERPIAAGASLRILGQQRAAIWTRHHVRAHRVRLS